MLFKPEHVEPILSGRKTQTRRLGKKRWRVGAIHRCYVRPSFAKGGSESFASVEIISVRRECLSDISDADILAEGYDSFPAYWDALHRITHGRVTPTSDLWVVTFALVTP
jgi:hypothetical protein